MAKFQLSCLDEMFRTGYEVGEGGTFAAQHAFLVPILAQVATTTHVCYGEQEPSVAANPH